MIDFNKFMLSKGEQYSLVDKHVFNSLGEPIIKPSKETVVTAWLFGIFVILIALAHWFVMLPFRLIVDIKNSFRDFLRGMDK